MHGDLRALADRQCGVITRQQALAIGMTERQLKTATGHAGVWVVVRRGAYAERWAWDAADEAGRHLMRVSAANLAAPVPYLLSHSSAAVVHGLDLRAHTRELVHVTHPRVLGGRTEGGVKHHPAAVPDQQVVMVDGLLVTSLERTGVDVAREYGLEDGTIVCDQILRRGRPRAALEEVLVQMRCWPHVTTARAVVGLADGGAENLAESLARLFVTELGYGRPATQVWIEDAGRRARVDMLLMGHVFEFDGKLKFLGRDAGGVASEPVEDILWREKQREDWLRSLGFGISRLVWADLFGVRRREALRRTERELLATLSRRTAGRTG